MSLLGVNYGSDDDSDAEAPTPIVSANKGAGGSSSGASGGLKLSPPSHNKAIPPAVVVKPKKRKKKRAKIAVSILPPEIQAALARAPSGKDSDDDDDEAGLDAEEQEKRRKLRAQVAETKAVQGRSKAGATGLSALLPKPKADEALDRALAPKVATTTAIKKPSPAPPAPSAPVSKANEESSDDEESSTEGGGGGGGLKEEKTGRQEEEAGSDREEEEDDDEEGGGGSFHTSLLAGARAAVLPRTSMFNMGSSINAAPAVSTSTSTMSAAAEEEEEQQQHQQQQRRNQSQEARQGATRGSSTGASCQDAASSEWEAFHAQMTAAGYDTEQIRAYYQQHQQQQQQYYQPQYQVPLQHATPPVQAEDAYYGGGDGEDFGAGAKARNRRDAKRLQRELAAGNLAVVDKLSGGQVAEMAPLEEKWDPYRHGPPKKTEKVKIAASFYDTKSGQTVTVTDASRNHKRKHHINALAMQAAEREADLMEGKGRSMLTKAQTQGKYGWVGLTTQGSCCSGIEGYATRNGSESSDSMKIEGTSIMFDRLNAKSFSALYSFLPTPELLSFRCVNQSQLERFHAAGIHWDEISHRLVVELHASRMTLETAHHVCGTSPLSSSPLRRLVPKPLAVGHRGAPGSGLRGNSLESFHHAVHIGADMIELDVCIDRSGDVVVHHDLYLSDGRLLEQLTLREIKRVAPEVEPLSVVLRELRASNVSLYLDLKTDKVVAPLMRLLHEAISKGGWAPSRLLIASFNQYDMIEVNAHRLAYPSSLSEVQTCIIVDGVPIALAKEYAALDVKWCSIGDGCVLPSFLHDAHSRGIGVMVWTVNNSNVMSRYLALGVDAVVSDFPERFVSLRDSITSIVASPTSMLPPPPSSGDNKTGISDSNSSGDIINSNHYGSNLLAPSSSPPSPPLPVHDVLLSAYPTPLHQPRTRLVRALHQTWPLLRALEGRGSSSSNNDTAKPMQVEEIEPEAKASSNSNDSSSQKTATGGGRNHMHHLKAAARQAEESATAVLQPRLPKEGPSSSSSSSSISMSLPPQTPPRPFTEDDAICRMVPPTTTAVTSNNKVIMNNHGQPPGMAPAFGSSLSDDNSKRSNSNSSPSDGSSSNNNHSQFFLPFERLWARRVS